MASDACAVETEAGSDGLALKSDDGDYELRIGGRLHYDVIRFNDDLTPLSDRQGFRRARVALSGRFADDWRFRVEKDVGDSAPGWKGVWLAYRGFDHWDLRAGHLIAPVGMEQMMGSNDSPLMERSMASVLSPGFLLGAQATYARRGWTASLGYYGDPIDQEEDSTGQDGHGVAGRVTFAPLRKKGKAVHVGASFEKRSVDRVNGTRGYRISSRPGAGLSDRVLIGTGTIADVARSDTFGVELAAIAGPFTVLTERLHTRLDRDAGPGLGFTGWHATAAWTLTGERRDYNDDTGAIGRIKPKRRWGALELAARYDRLDLEDGDITGGRGRNFAYGLNWYLGENFRLMLNHADVRAEPNNDGLRETVGVDQLRAQIDF